MDKGIWTNNPFYLSSSPKPSQILVVVVVGGCYKKPLSSLSVANILLANKDTGA